MRFRSGFTLAQTLVVLVIVGVLCAVLLPVVARAKGSALRPMGISQLRQLGIAQSLYRADSGEFATNADSLSSWHEQLDLYFPEIARLHPPLFVEPNRTEGSSGYVVNSCVRDIERRDYDASRLVLMSEYALLKTRDGEATGEISTFVRSVPDVGSVMDAKHQFPSSEIWLDGIEASTKYQGRGLYLLLDGHIASSPPNGIDFHPGFPYACEPSTAEPPSPSGRLTYRLSRN